jgi:hypothetical protein
VVRRRQERSTRVKTALVGGSHFRGCHYSFYTDAKMGWLTVGAIQRAEPY